MISMNPAQRIEGNKVKRTSRRMEISGSSEGQRNLVKSLIFL